MVVASHEVLKEFGKIYKLGFMHNTLALLLGGSFGSALKENKPCNCLATIII